MADLRRALEFVEANGDALERARARALLDGNPPPRDVLAELEKAQNADGGWPAFWSGGRSSVDATCFRLAQLDDLAPAGDKLAGRALACLIARRRSDGTWEEAEAVAGSGPPWVVPGNEAARLYLTANCAYWLRDERAASYLAAAVGRDGRLPGPLQAHWLAAAVLEDAGRHDDAERVFAYLETRVGDLGPSGLGWLAITVPHTRVAAQARERLERLQRDDGGWSSEDGAMFDVEATLAAIRASAAGRG
jgi:hypothetical protein